MASQQLMTKRRSCPQLLFSFVFSHWETRGVCSRLVILIRYSRSTHGWGGGKPCSLENPSSSANSLYSHFIITKDGLQIRHERLRSEVRWCGSPAKKKEEKILIGSKSLEVICCIILPIPYMYHSPPPTSI